MNNNRVPPMVEQLVQDCLDPKQPQHVRENKAMIIEEIIKFCESAMMKHKMGRKFTRT